MSIFGFDASAVRRRYDDTAEAIASVVSLRSVLPRHREIDKSAAEFAVAGGES